MTCIIYMSAMMAVTMSVAMSIGDGLYRFLSVVLSIGKGIHLLLVT